MRTMHSRGKACYKQIDENFEAFQTNASLDLQTKLLVLSNTLRFTITIIAFSFLALIGPKALNGQISIDTSAMVVTQPDCGLNNGTVVGITATGGTAPYTYTWDSAGQFISSGFSADLLNVYFGVYQLTAVDANLDTARFSIRLTALNVPNLVLTATDTIICAGQTSILTGSGYTGGFVVWTGAGIPPTFGSNVNVTPTVSTTYYFTWNNGPCVIQDSIEILVVSPPTITSQPDTVCPGDTAILTAAVQPQISGLIIWSGGDLPGLDTGASIIVTPSTAQTYQVDWINGGCSSVSTVNVSVSSSPPIQINPTNPSTCSGSPVTLVASAGGSGGTYTWSGGDLLNPVLNDSVTVSPSANQTYTVNWSNGGCSSTENVTVQVGSIPIWVTASTDTICINSTTTLTANGQAGGTYTWSGGDLPAPVTGTSISVSPGSTTTYDLNWTDGTCTADTSFQVTVLNVQTILISFTNPTCGANNGNIIAAGTGGSAQYQFRFIRNGQTVQFLSSSTLNNAAPGSYQIITVDQTYGCLSSPVNLTLVDTTSFPTITISILDSVDCFGDTDGSVQVNANGGSGRYSYSWSHDAALTSTIATGLSSGIQYSVDVLDSVCPNPITTNYTVPGPTDSISINAIVFPDTCSNGNGQIRTNPSGGNGPQWTYQWSNGSSGSSLNSLFGGSQYSVTVFDDKNCQGLGTYSIDNIGAPSIRVVSKTDSICPNDNSGSILISVNDFNPPYTYQWSHDPFETDSLAEGLSTGNYIVTVTNNLGCANISNPINIGEFPSGTLVLGNDTSIIRGQTIKITPLVTDQVSTINWAPDRFLAESGFSVFLFPLETTPYVAEGVSENGCKVYDTLVVFVDTPAFSIYIPNVFTPNGDGVNDFHYVDGENIETFEMQIFDRWGNLVYKTFDLNSKWDGRDPSGTLLSSGVYSYITQVKTFGSTDSQPPFTGNITLIR